MSASGEQKTFTYRYSWITAYKLGYDHNPYKVMQSFGVKIIKAHDAGVADCTFFMVDRKIEPLPPMLEESSFQFAE